MSRKGSKKSKSRVSELSDTHGTKTRGSKLATPKVSGTKADAAMSITQTTHAQTDVNPGHQVIVQYCNKRKSFTRSVVTTGIKAAVVRALVALYEEPKKPDNALGYLACFMGADLPTEEDVKGKLEEIRTMRERINTLEEENEKMAERVQELEEEALKKISNRENMGEFEGGDEEEEFFDEAQDAQDNFDEFNPFGSCITSTLSFAVNL